MKFYVSLKKMTNLTLTHKCLTNICMCVYIQSFSYVESPFFFNEDALYAMRFNILNFE